MADGGLTVLDGSRLLTAVDHLSPLESAPLTGAQLLEIAESQASSSLVGLSLPENLKSGVSLRLNLDGSFYSLQLDQETAFSKLKDYFLALADELKDDPLVVSVLDGSALRLFFEDEDDIAMLAENLFTDLDTEDKGKLKTSEIQNALIRMGVEMGVPPFSESEALLTKILKKNEAMEGEELGQAQFAKLLEAVLRDLADALAEKHVVVIHKIRVINGSKLRKVLADEKLLNSVIKRIFEYQSTKESGKGCIGNIRGFLHKNGHELGFPPLETNEAVGLLYSQVLDSVDKEKGGELERDQFGVIVKEILEEFANQLDASPIFCDRES